MHSRHQSKIQCAISTLNEKFRNVVYNINGAGYACLCVRAYAVTAGGLVLYNAKSFTIHVYCSKFRRALACGYKKFPFQKFFENPITQTERVSKQAGERESERETHAYTQCRCARWETGQRFRFSSSPLPPIFSTVRRAWSGRERGSGIETCASREWKPSARHFYEWSAVCLARSNLHFNCSLHCIASHSAFSLPRSV